MSGTASCDVLKILAESSAWSERNENALLEPFTHISAVPGKDIRGQMVDAFNAWLRVPDDKLSIISRVINMLHNASLLIDDIEDDAQLRRGVPASHKIYGVPQTINTANYVYFLAYQQLFALRSHVQSQASTSPPQARLMQESDLDRIVTEELLSLHRGQGLELLWRDSLQCPTEEEYIGMVNNKTGGLFRVAVKLMMACATENVDVDFVPLVNVFGVYFQIRDDYMNLQSTEYSSNKGFAEDLTEGKFSFPVVHGVRNDPSRQILNVLQKRPTTPTLKTYTIAYLRDQTKSFEYTLSVMATLEQQIHDEIARLGGNAKLEKIMQMLHVPT